jgi:hypothetical protein
MSGSAEMITNEVRRLVLTCRHLQAELEQSIPKKAHEEIVQKMQGTIDSQDAEMKRMDEELQKAVSVSSTLSSMESLLSAQSKEISAEKNSIENVYAKIAEGTVPRQIYEASLAATKSLEENARRLMEQKNSELRDLQVRNHELLERISGMVPRTDYLTVQSQLSESIPRVKHEEDVQKLRDQSVPRDLYTKAQSRISELESTLEQTVPKSEFVDLMKEVSTLTNGPLAVTYAEPQNVTVVQAPETAASDAPVPDAPAPQVLAN